MDPGSSSDMAKIPVMDPGSSSSDVAEVPSMDHGSSSSDSTLLLLLYCRADPRYFFLLSFPYRMGNKRG
jgi:hypothetical protein